MAEYSIYNSQWTAQQIEASIGKNPRIGDDGTWEVWDMAMMQWVDTGIAPSGGVPIPFTHNLLKGDGNGGVVAGADESDFQSKITASGILKGNGAGGISAAVAGTDFAPGGFGLGSVTNNAITDCNDTTLGIGFYTLYAATLNYPALIPNAAYGILLVQRRNESIYQSFSYGEYFAKRLYTGTTWKEWEYINPPMQLGVEYRTTERYLGKPVYVKAVNCGAISANTRKQVGLGSANVSVCIGCYVEAEYNVAGTHVLMPFYDPTNTAFGEVMVTTSSGASTINIHAKSAVLASTAVVKYTKTTD